jgi:hypothetical protein
MDNFFNNGPTILKLIVRIRIYDIIIYMYIQKKNVDLETGFLRIFIWKFIEVKRTINDTNIM